MNFFLALKQAKFILKYVLNSLRQINIDFKKTLIFNAQKIIMIFKEQS